MEKGILGNTIRNKRIELGYSQEELAEFIGITPTHLKHLESEHRKPSIEVLVKLMQHLKFSFDAIIFSDNNRLKEKELLLLLTSCSDKELNILQDLILSLKKNN